jgi:hypothetical protein
MTAAESTRRDLALIKGYEFVPTSWSRVDQGTVVLGRDGIPWMVESIEKLYAVAIVVLVLGAKRHTVEVPLADGVHVLDHTTGPFSTEHAGFPLVRARRGVS